jgi:hypothetical protein
MAFVAEDGTGLANANSLVAVAYADSYFADRGITAWTGLQADKETALVRATDYVVGRFRFKLDPFSATQALPFPTVNDDPTSDPTIPAAMPVKLLKAVCEYAVRALTVTLAPDPTIDDTGQKIIGKTETVGPITETTTYTPGGTTYVFRPYPAADMLIRDLTRSTGGVIRA